MDKEVFANKVLENEQSLYRVSMSMLRSEADAQDAVYDAILTAYEKINTLRNDDSFSSWLMQILVRNCYKTLKRRKRFEDSGEDLPEETSRDNPYINVEIGEAISSLSPKIRAVVLLYYVEDYSIKEIHRILNIPIGTVKSRLNKGRNQIKSFLK